MDKSLRQQLGREAKALWNAGRALEAGKLLFERVPIEHQAEWSANILEIACDHFLASPEIEAVLKFARNPDIFGRGTEGEWREAHKIVTKVMMFPYLLPEPFSQTIFTLAINVGKVAYNAQGFPAPFDYDAGWEIVATLLQIVQGWNDAEFEEKVWSLLCDEKFLSLETPLTDPSLYPEWFSRQTKQI